MLFMMFVSNDNLKKIPNKFQMLKVRYKNIQILKKYETKIFLRISRKLKSSNSDI